MDYWNIAYFFMKSYSICLEILNRAQDKYIPKKTVAGGNKKKTQGITAVKVIKKKHRAWQRYMETQSEEKYREYTRLRNKVKSITRRAQHELEKDIAHEVKNNPKRFWNYVKSRTKIKARIPDLFKDVKNHKAGMAETDEDKAQVLSSFFSSVFTKEPEGDIPDATPRDVHTMIETVKIKEDVVRKKLNKLNTTKSMGQDKVHPRVLKELIDTIKTPLTILFNATIAEGAIPELWKQGNISAIHKKGDKRAAANYRPVSLTSVICKLMESVLRDSIISHMKSHNLFSKYQYGFVSGRSTTLQLLQVIEEWTEWIDGGGSVDVCYLDFMKAFDTVPHRRLAAKVHSYGTRGQMLEWIQSFLRDRKQRVQINGTASSWCGVESGIPQGSVLGPLLLYINDLPDTILSCVKLYADDTKLYRQINSDEDEQIFQADINRLQGWSDKWLLRFHPDKCKAMSVGKKQEVPANYYMISEDGERIALERVSKEKDLGVTWDEDLSFREEIANRVQKANNIMGVIRRTYVYLDVQSFKLLYKSLVRPHLEYAAPIWDPHYKKDKKQLESVQRRATSQIPSLKEFTYEERLCKLGLPTLRLRRLRGDMIEAYKILSGLYDIDGEGFLELSDNRTTRGHSLKLKKKTGESVLRRNCFSQRIFNHWNSLTESIVTAPTLNAFKNRLDALWSDHPLKYDWEASDYLASHAGAHNI